MELPPLRPHDKVKLRAAALAQARGFGLVGIRGDVWAVGAGGVLTLLARARDNESAWRAALDALERATP
jgi:hypothetical protein